MKLIDFDDIKGLGIDPAVCIDWVEEGLLNKSGAQLPPKTSIRPADTLDGTFVNTMPCFVDFIERGASRLSPAIPTECRRFPRRFYSMTLRPANALPC